MMVQYVSQLILFQLVFLLVYELFLKKETFFNYNRAYLLITPVLAGTLPFVQFGFFREAFPSEVVVMLPEVVLGESNKMISGTSSEVVKSTFNMNWWLITYLGGAVISFILFLVKFRSLLSLFRFKAVTGNKDVRIVEVPDSNIACTFYSTIFLGDNIKGEERDQILSHELVHVNQKHTLDLLFFEVLKILLWFNPLIYIYQSLISTLHEFIADAGVVKKVEKKQYFQQLLNTAFNTKDISFINQFFNHSIIKKRIVMLQKSRSTTVSKFKFLILIPVVMCMLTYVSCSQENQANTEENELNATSNTGVFTLEVKDILNQTDEEKSKIEGARATLKAGDIEKLQITDGTKTIEFSLDPETGKEQIKITNNSGVRSKVKGTSKDLIAFSEIDEVPVFPGCEELATNEERKQCMTEKIAAHISANFNTSIGKELGLTSVNRVYVQFKINTDGNIDLVKSRAPHEKLEAEAIRVINELPQMTPGKHNGKEVAVLYTLPISFKVD